MCRWRTCVVSTLVRWSPRRSSHRRDRPRIHSEDNENGPSGRDSYRLQMRMLTRRLANWRKERVFGGISSGANIFAALQVARQLGPGHKVVTVIVDSGLRYLAGTSSANRARALVNPHTSRRNNWVAMLFFNKL